MKISAPMFQHARLALAGLIVLLGIGQARADTLVLTNGDIVSGAVVSMDQATVQLKSDLLGLVKIPRDRVAKINLREIASKPVTAAVGTNSTNHSAAPPARTLNNVRTNRADAAVQQLRQQGVDPKVMNQIQQQVLGDSSPEANRLFNEMVGGLMSGSLTADDIRAQARKAINDINAAKSDLGDDDAIGELLNGYLGLLQNFVQDGDQPAPPAGKPAVTPPPAASTK